MSVKSSIVFLFSLSAATVEWFPLCKVGCSKTNKHWATGQTSIFDFRSAAAKKHSDGSVYWERWAERTFKVPHSVETWRDLTSIALCSHSHWFVFCCMLIFQPNGTSFWDAICNIAQPQKLHRPGCPREWREGTIKWSCWGEDNINSIDCNWSSVR